MPNSCSTHAHLLRPLFYLNGVAAEFRILEISLSLSLRRGALVLGERESDLSVPFLLLFLFFSQRPR